MNKETTANDMMQVFQYFTKRQAEDPRFYYTFDLDENSKVKSMFWADARSRDMYAMYGDCVSFDTTYLTNRYNLPFAPIIGITGHGNTCIFGCAFLVDETITTFKWVFSKFLDAMEGKAPKTIITDQDGAMKSAISQIFPATNHRNCFFHIKKKAYEKGSRAFHSKSGLQEEFEDTLNNSLTINEFEELWQQMIQKYEVQNIKYFQTMWESRQKFVPVYFKNHFYPFLQSTKEEFSCICAKF